MASLTMTKRRVHRDRVEVLSGTLDLLVLQALRWGPRHGYGISQMIRASSQQTMRVETGSLYPALHRLEREKLIAADWTVSENKQRIRVYHLTAAGKRQLVAKQSWWSSITAVIARLAEPPIGESEA
jgi:PadR family transcriptional regulator PadR